MNGDLSINQETNEKCIIPDLLTSKNLPIIASVLSQEKNLVEEIDLDHI